MKIQLKRSLVLDGPNAKQPTSAQMEYGELAVNYSTTDPAIFLKNDTDGIVRIGGAGYDYDDLVNTPTIGDGTLTINNSDGSSAGTFTANQTGDTTISLPAGFSGSWDDLTGVPDSITGDYDDLENKPTIGDATINITQDGSNLGSFTTNQDGVAVDIDIPAGAVYAAEAGKGIAINASNEISIGDNWSNIPALA